MAESVLRFGYFIEDNDSEYVCEYVNIHYTYERLCKKVRTSEKMVAYLTMRELRKCHRKDKKRKDPNRFVEWVLFVIRGLSGVVISSMYFTYVHFLLLLFDISFHFPLSFFL